MGSVDTRWFRVGQGPRAALGMLAGMALLAGCGEAASPTTTPADTVAPADGLTGSDVAADSGAGADAVADALLADAASDAVADDVASQTDAAAPTDTAGQTDALADSADPVDVAAGTDAALATDAATSSDAAAGTDATTGTDAASSGDAADVTVDPSQVQCTGASPVFPAYSTNCQADADCAVALHQIDCCGSHVAVGVATSDLGYFQAAEAICEAQYPDCKCAAKMPLGQDGVHLADVTEFGAVCIDGVCLAKAKAGPDCKSQVGWSPWKWCQKTSDCSYTLHTTDCCGSQQAVGVAKVAKSAYEKTEYKCAPEPLCDCLPKPVTAEDGGSAGDGLIAVTCEAGLCQTYIK